ncbi:FAD-dependent pyridine nucleotide-disulfide oxidoreductase [Monoraphidium neglectum]|uniref:FAD-dependent pyridine nucleotide-disulfide oxidoreductase n=1 Tax=Monoraphidium neglectum TaxID=145388 RepID=A0A0D2MR48_9CHLO|nr:FAD-dependent pyridine nucleotide-disulfide oxidoreductase [Monoraphidium neglectum]KIZ05075.1 FAD-dependent pyridine nucleotide-disulfide oxidoreductase [Monoraphidium neglectum]|eukprot:XP_013904094.1 FAD-dependent pyridine nucleotide-disulfide oxidoreductase [Monoraphidium neglectum]
MHPAALAARRVVVIGGVAGGASCAARLRRLTETAEITLFERGANVSFANCGLPYYVGGVITDESKLLVANAAKFKSWFNVDVRERTEVVAIDRQARTITARELPTGREYSAPFDALVLAPGAQAIRPPLPGIDLPGIFQMKTIPDSNAVRSFIEANGVRRAVVVGAGFIGLEMVENLVHRGVEVTLLEAGSQVMPPLDPEMAQAVSAVLASKGVKVVLGDGVAGFEQGPGGKGMMVRTSGGKTYDADMAMLVIGVRPDTALAKTAGLELGARGGIRVDEHMRTSDPVIYAVGDAVESKDWVTGEWGLCPLAGPANRQGRIAADNIAGRDSKFRGTQGTAVVGLFGLTIASTGANEKTLKRLGRPYVKVYTHANNHAGYYPGASTIDFKLLFDPKDGLILGCQATGTEGVDKRVDVVAALMQLRGSVFDLEEAELCYAPQYGSAKDVLNLAGMVAANHLRGDHPIVSWDDLPRVKEEVAAGTAVLVDVREPSEVARGTVEGALNYPLSSLRARLHELPKGKRCYVFCQVGLRGYNATRQLLLAGRDAVNISGGWRSALQAGVVSSTL